MTDGRREVFAAADVCSLRCGGARAAAVTAGDAAFSAVQAEWTMLVPAVLSYRPGEFFLREPPLRTVLARVRNLGLLVIDGYADLDPGGRPGLGAHAHAAFGVPVIVWLPSEAGEGGHEPGGAPCRECGQIDRGNAGRAGDGEGLLEPRARCWRGKSFPASSR